MRRIPFLTVVVSLFIFSLSINAQNFNDALRLSEPGLGSGARALGMGNSFIAVADDYSAAMINPAGLGLMKRMEFTGMMKYNSFANDVTLYGNTTSDDRASTDLGRIGLVFPYPVYRGSLVFAIGFNREKSFNRVISFNGYNSGNHSMIQELAANRDDLAYYLGLSYPVNTILDETLINGNLNQDGKILQEGNLNSWSFSGAMEVSKGLFVGVTLNIKSGEFNSTRDYYEEDTRDVYGDDFQLDPDDSRTAGFVRFYMNDIIKWDLSGWDMKLGMLYNINKFSRLGVTVKFPTTYTVKETYFTDGYSDFTSSSGFEFDAYEENFEYDITTPFELGAGAAFDMFGLILSGDINVIDYTSMEFSDGLTSEARLNNNKEIKDIFRTAVNYSVGAEYKIPMTSLLIRAGYMYKPSPFKDDPSDYDRKYLTGGLGIVLNENVSIDVGYAHGFWKDYNDNYGIGLSRNYHDIKNDRLFVSFSSRF